MMYRAFIVATVLAISALGTPRPASAQGGFFDEVFDPVHHTHFSDLGTPFVHPFNFEPPQIHQDAFFIYRYTKNTFDGGNEHEAEAHLDWSLTRRLGFVVGAPLLGLEDGTGIQSAGPGDLEVAPRAMLIEQDKFILASNTFITIPTGDASRGLGADEVVIRPHITTWHDLGNWNTLLFNVGPDIGVDSGMTAMTYAFSLTHSWVGRQLLADDHDVEDEHGEGHQHHFSPGMTSLYLEMTGETELGGDKRTFVELMPGISYVLTAHAELRFGVLLPVSNLHRFDSQYFTSFTWIH